MKWCYGCAPAAGRDAPEVLKLPKCYPYFPDKLFFVVICQVGFGGVMQIQQVYLQSTTVTHLLSLAE